MNEITLTDSWKVVKKLNDCGWDVAVSKPVSERTIWKAQQALDVTFPSSYREFLKEFGAICVGESYVCGIIDDNISKKRDGAVLFETLRARKECDLPQPYIVVDRDQNVCVCLDTSKLDDAHEECPIVLFNRSAKRIEQAPDIYFIEYLYDFLKRHLN